jgi:urease accessory protein UreF
VFGIAGAAFGWPSGAAARMNIDELSSFAPALEIAAINHARLDARLFRS